MGSLRVGVIETPMPAPGARLPQVFRSGLGAVEAHCRLQKPSSRTWLGDRTRVLDPSRLLVRLQSFVDREQLWIPFVEPAQTHPPADDAENDDAPEHDP